MVAEVPGHDRKHGPAPGCFSAPTGSPATRLFFEREIPMSDKPLLRGLDSPEHLRAWMEAAGREFVVVRVADILDMTEDDQRLWLQIFNAAKIGKIATNKIDEMACDILMVPLDGQTLRRMVQAQGVNGYIKVARDEICSLSLDDLQVVQQWLSIYREVRLGKGEPSRTDPCDWCKGKGCTECGGEGETITFLEISDEEAALSEGRKS